MALKSVVGKGGFASWVRKLKHKSGVYRIVSKGKTLYVGSSSKNRMYGTLTRHFQRWERSRPADMTGYVFDRKNVLVEVKVTSAGEIALSTEKAWIARFDPLLNRENSEYNDDPIEDDDLVDALASIVQEGIPF